MKDYRISLIDKREICDNTIAFTFDRTGIDYNFKAGQYAHFTIENPDTKDKEGHSRPFSIASSPDIKETLMIAARIGSSVFMDNLLNVKSGEQVFVSKASGDLFLQKDESMVNVFIAGGIGITPARSIVEFATGRKLPNRIVLFYSNKTESQTSFISDFEQWAEVNDKFKFITSIEDKDNLRWKYEYGGINSERLRKHLGDFENKYFYIIGPPVMVESVKNLLLKENINEQNIKTEKFK